MEASVAQSTLYKDVENSSALHNRSRANLDNLPNLIRIQKCIDDIKIENCSPPHSDLVTLDSEDENIEDEHVGSMFETIDANVLNYIHSQNTKYQYSDSSSESSCEFVDESVNSRQNLDADPGLESSVPVVCFTATRTKGICHSQRGGKVTTRDMVIREMNPIKVNSAAIVRCYSNIIFIIYII